MKFTCIVVSVLWSMGCHPAFADSRNPFEPVRSQSKQGAPALTRNAPVLPPVLPPPMAPKPGSFQSIAAPRPPKDVGEAPARTKPKESPMRSTAASCQIKVKTVSMAAPAFGGIVTLVLQGGARDCVSAVLVEENWLEAKEITDPNAIRFVVDANDGSAPRQSSITVANAGQSVSVTLVQEGRVPRTP